MLSTCISQVNGNKPQLTEFREFIVQPMTTSNSTRQILTPSKSKEIGDQKRQTRKSCSRNYKHMSISNGSAHASKKTNKLIQPIYLDCFKKSQKCYKAYVQKVLP